MNQTTITTLEERKSAEAARRKGAADQVVAELRDYARRNAGRFIVFGSYASSQMRFDSDLDLLIDFPQSGAAEAWQFAEEVCARHAIPLDVHDANTAKPEFLNRVRASGVFLP